MCRSNIIFELHDHLEIVTLRLVLHDMHQRPNERDRLSVFCEAALIEDEMGSIPTTRDLVAISIACIERILITYPSSSSVCSNAMKAICRLFAKIPQYCDYDGLAWLWVWLTNKRPYQLETYAYMHRNRIGRQPSFFTNLGWPLPDESYSLISRRKSTAKAAVNTHSQVNGFLTDKNISASYSGTS